MADKGKLPPSFRKAAKKIEQTAPSKGETVVDPEGKPGRVVSVAGGMVKVRHATGTDIHPVGSVRRVQAPDALVSAPPVPKKKTKKKV